MAPLITGFLPRLRVGRNPEPKARTIHPRVEPMAFWFMGKEESMREKELMPFLEELRKMARQQAINLDLPREKRERAQQIADSTNQAIRGEYPPEEEPVISPAKREEQPSKEPVSDTTPPRERVFEPASWGGRGRSRGDPQRSLRRHDPAAEEKRLRRALKRPFSKEEKLFKSLKKDKAA